MPNRRAMIAASVLAVVLAGVTAVVVSTLPPAPRSDIGAAGNASFVPSSQRTVSSADGPTTSLSLAPASGSPVCGTAELDGPDSPPSGAVTIPAGDMAPFYALCGHHLLLRARYTHLRDRKRLHDRSRR